MRIINYGIDNRIKIPVSGGGSALSRGAMLQRGATPGTNNGMAILAAGNNANPDILGILQEAHLAANDTNIGGTIFTTHPVDLVSHFRVVRAEYSLAPADLIACTSAVGGTSLAVTSLEDDIDAAFIYVVSGTGAGQTNYLTASSAGNGTLKAAFASGLDTTSRFIKILPRFHQLASFTSDGIKLSSQAAAGQTPVIVLDTWMVKGGNEIQMSPVDHAAQVGLNGIVPLRFEADIMIRNAIPYSID